LSKKKAICLTIAQLELANRPTVQPVALVEHGKRGPQFHQVKHGLSVKAERVLAIA